MTIDSDLDFLADDAALTAGEPAAPDPIEAVERVRGELLDWAAEALRRRCPSALAYRGRKGEVQCRLDLDRHLKQALEQLRASPANMQVAELQNYKRWLADTVFSPRGSPAESIAMGATVLAEALVRFVPGPLGAHLAAHLLAGLGCSDPYAARMVAERNAAG